MFHIWSKAHRDSSIVGTLISLSGLFYVWSVRVMGFYLFFCCGTKKNCGFFLNSRHVGSEQRHPSIFYVHCSWLDLPCLSLTIGYFTRFLYSFWTRWRQWSPPPQHCCASLWQACVSDSFDIPAPTSCLVCVHMFLCFCWLWHESTIKESRMSPELWSGSTQSSVWAESDTREKYFAR